MKIFYTLFFFLFFYITVNAQRFDGQWKGGFTDNSTGFIGFGGDKIDYVLELECNGASVTGYSYTYFTERAKRYYTICKLKGTVNKETKEIVVTEFERTKYNTPPEFRNCFQTHKLRYIKDSDAEVLQGNWIPAPNQTGDCGFGKTTLTRRLLKRVPQFNASKPDIAGNKKSPSFKDLNRLPQPVAAPKQKSIKNPATKPRSVVRAPVVKNNTTAKAEKKITNDIPMIKSGVKEDVVTEQKLTFEKRLKSVLKTIEIEKDTFTVQLYDNGEIDGDSVSVFYNNSLLISHERLSDKPITLSLTFNKSDNTNELTMYAENLGTIPPNTALMVVTDGDKRYEVRITSDTQKNGTIIFTHK